MVDSTRYLILHGDFLVHISHSAGLDVHHVSFFRQTFGSHPDGGAGRQDDNQSRAFCFTFSNEWSSVGERSIPFTAKGWSCKTNEGLSILRWLWRKKALHVCPNYNNKPATPTDTTEKNGVVQPPSRAQRNTIWMSLGAGLMFSKSKSLSLLTSARVSRSKLDIRQATPRQLKDTWMFPKIVVPPNHPF